SFVCGIWILGACGNSESGPESLGSAGTTGTGTGGAVGNAMSGASGGTMNSGGAGAVSGTGGAGIAGATSDGGAQTDAASTDARVDDANGPRATAGCAGKDYALCIDFENGIDTATWSAAPPAPSSRPTSRMAGTRTASIP